MLFTKKDLESNKKLESSNRKQCEEEGKMIKNKK